MGGKPVGEMSLCWLKNHLDVRPHWGLRGCADLLSLSAVTKLTKQLMLLEEEKKRLEEGLERSREEAQASVEEVRELRARLRDAVSQEEHCNITENLRR